MALWSRSPRPRWTCSSGAGPLYWILFALVLLGELHPIRVPRREAEISTATAFSYAALLAFGTPAAVVAQAVGSLLTDLVRRRPLSRAVFNVAQYTLSLAAAGAVLSLVAGVPFTDPLPAFSPSEIPAVVLAGAAFFAVNNCLAGTASALAHRAPVLRNARRRPALPGGHGRGAAGPGAGDRRGGGLQPRASCR